MLVRCHATQQYKEVGLAMHVLMWVNLRCIRESLRGQTQKHAYRMFSYRWRSAEKTNGRWENSQQSLRIEGWPPQGGAGVISTWVECWLNGRVHLSKLKNIVRLRPVRFTVCTFYLKKKFLKKNSKAGVSRLWPRDPVWPTTRFCKSHVIDA